MWACESDYEYANIHVVDMCLLVCVEGGVEDIYLVIKHTQRVELARTIPGKMNDKVLPEPVCAMPTVFLPDIAIGQPWDWIGVGASNFSSIKVSRT